MAPRLLSYLSSFGGLGPDERSDIVQRIFLKAWRSRTRLEEGPRLSGWLFRAARSQALDELKARDRERRRFPPEPLKEDESGIDAPGHYPGPEEGAAANEARAFMERFLAGLDDAERELSSLAYGEGLSYPEIAKITGAPVGTIKWRASRLRDRLRRAYREEFGE